MDKATLRKRLIAQRKELDAADVAERSRSIIEMIIDRIETSKIEKIHCFLPITDSNEPDLRQFIDYATAQGAEVFTTVPNAPVDMVDSVIRTYSLNDETQFDLIIVPLLAYDPATNHRLGFGGGFYDRLLNSQPNALSVGVCFKEFAIDNLPVESHDQPLQKMFAV